MNGPEKWIDWDKPVTVLSTLAQELRIPDELVKLLRPGAFTFKDGTTQGWKIDQLYDTNAKTLAKINPYTNPTTKQFYGFILSNSNNLALSAGAYPLHLPGTKVTSLDFYLESPDLISNQDWKSIQGYNLDLQRNFLSLCGDPPSYYVQMQIKVWDQSQKKMKIFCEWDDKVDKPMFHSVNALQPYHFIWTADVFKDPNMELRALRIRFTQPNFTTPGSGECLPKGEWLVGNISPEW
jgi:hypothetical protein